MTAFVQCDLDSKDYPSAYSHQAKLVALRRNNDDPPELADALWIQGQVAALVNRNDEAYTAISESLTIAATLPAVNQKFVIDANSELCWTATLSGKHAAALAAGEKAVALLKNDKPCSVWMNLAHAYLFNGQYEKAESIYNIHLGTAYEDGRKWNDELRNNFKTLRAAGRDHPDMTRIEALLD